MARAWIIAVLLAASPGCERTPGRMARPEDPHGRFQDQIAAASRLLDQREDWAHRAEWEVRESSEGWTVTAWRVEHPERRGPERYVPWGYSVIELDRRMTAIGYRRKG